MVSFFFWFGVISFSVIVIILLASGIVIDIIVDFYRFLYALNLKRSNKPKFEINEIVEWSNKLYRVSDRYFKDMNSDYKFGWRYQINALNPSIYNGWDNDEPNIVHVLSDNLKKTKFKKREDEINKILE